MAWPNTLDEFTDWEDATAGVPGSGVDVDAAALNKYSDALEALQLNIGLDTDDALLGGYDSLAEYLVARFTTLLDLDTDYLVEHNEDGTHGNTKKLRCQVVADATARGNISSPREGDLVWQSDTDTLFVYDGAAWDVVPGASHSMLDGSIHSDSVADGVTRGSLIYGNATPKWDELVIGGAGTYLRSDGTDASWGALANHDHTGDAGDGAKLDHGAALDGRGDDDHTQYLLVAGSRALSGDWDIGDGRMIQTDKIRARDGAGLSLFEDGGVGIFIEDGGKVILDQGAADGMVMAFRSSDVATGMTDHANTTTFGFIRKSQALAGGLNIWGLSDADGDAGYALFLRGAVGEAVDTTKSVAGVGCIHLDGVVKNGATVAGAGADANLVVIASAGFTYFIFDKEGEMHSDAVIGAGDDWDEWDDLQLASDLSRLPKAKFDQMMKYNAEAFERAGLLTLSTDEEGNRHAFIKHKAMLQFTMCCFAEVAKKLRAYESALLSLGVQPGLLMAGV